MSKETYMSPKEAADYLEKSLLSVYKYINDGKLSVAQEEGISTKRNRLLYTSEVKEFKNRTSKPGWTTGDIGKKLNISASSVYSFIENGDLKGEKKRWGNREVYFVEPKEALRFIDWYQQERGSSTLTSPKKNEGKSFYSKKHNLYLFQELYSLHLKQMARVTSMAPIKVTDEQGAIYTIDEAVELGFKAKKIYEIIPHKTSKGYAHFKMPLPSSIVHPQFDLIEKIYEELSFSNIYLYASEGKLELFTKQFELTDLEKVYYEQLNKHLMDGSVVHKTGVTIANSSIETISFPVHRDYKDLLIKHAELKGISLGDYVKRIVETHVDQENNK
ncbi:helix-turn-helix domain-containing protein [Halobacillus litoralis]|uniref:DNA-binding protein n=1 Tax=Halobacillus litoralis TaxID=45668 RepID=A0A410MJJ9_9BACI|nr:helix-turn-helix domain-containing protein [Halobacillus litoralis]QAS54856.1 hypothetical protein HLI_21635 [Halobacillus litoralis]